jgi:Ca2+-binding RTX toxin-like protein
VEPFSLDTKRRMILEVRGMRVSVRAVVIGLSIGGVQLVALTPCAAVVIQGTNGDDSLMGTNSGDFIYAYSGDDYAEGRQQGDYLDMGAGQDQGHGNSDPDSLHGRGGWDDLYGEDGSDFLYDYEAESPIRDYLYGGAQNDEIHMDDGDGSCDWGFGGPGSDTRTKDPCDTWMQD